MFDITYPSSRSTTYTAPAATPNSSPHGTATPPSVVLLSWDNPHMPIVTTIDRSPGS